MPVRRVAPQTVAGQITGLLIVSVLLGVGLASAVLLHLINQGRNEENREIFVATQAARIATVVRQAQASTSPEELSALLDRLRSDRIEVTPIPLKELRPAGLSQATAEQAFIPSVEQALVEIWKLRPLSPAASAAGGRAIFVALNDRQALRFEVAPHGALHNILFVEAIGALSIITLGILLLSAYAVRWITSPLSSIASAARAFGRDEGSEPDLDIQGPHEMREAALALNDMHRRVRTLVKERTQMLTAIGHDLRTPLTRLRLRTERITEEPLRAAMLQDILMISEMLGETLAYVREGDQPEPATLVDLPSLLETITAQFLDIGHSVAYQGPDRLTFAGRAQGIGRAVANIVENATKYGAHTEITLHPLDEGAVEITVDDDGPGIAPSLLERVTEPFFKGDVARAQDGRVGFGLGLSIARHIAERHAGAIALKNLTPHGLHVTLMFGPLPIASAATLCLVS
jgi:signal transduction histidine kinase